jgi:hypothetical protein
VKRTFRYAATTKLKRNAADGLFTKPSMVTLYGIINGYFTKTPGVRRKIGDIILAVFKAPSAKTHINLRAGTRNYVCPFNPTVSLMNIRFFSAGQN